MLSALMALVLAQPPVFVEPVVDPTDVKARRFRDQLMLRLLEEGYPLVPGPEHATRTLRVEPTDAGMRVEAEGQDSRSFDVPTGPVLPLEAVHRAMQALDEVTPRVATDQRPLPRFAVHVDNAPQGTTADEVLDALVHEVLARHAAVVPLRDEPEAVLCAERLGDDVALSRAQRLEDCGLAPTVVALGRTDDAAAGTPLLDRDDLDRSLDTLMEEPETLDVQPRTTEPVAVGRPRVPAEVADNAATPPSATAPAIRIGVRTGVYGRISAADAAVGTSLRVGREPGPGGIFDLLFVPSSAPDISVFETSISGGFEWMWSLHPVVALRLAGLAGVQVHRFRQRTQEPGHQVDWTAEIPVGSSFRLGPRLRLDLTIRGGRSGSVREHRVEDVVVWRREAWRIGASVGLSYGWSPR